MLDDRLSFVRAPAIKMVRYKYVAFLMYSINSNVLTFHSMLEIDRSMAITLHYSTLSCSYRSVNVRLRKLGRPEVDVSTERLQLRENIEYEVDRILKDFGFDKVDVDVDVSHQADDTNEHAYTKKKDKTSRTVWKRKLQLYRRRET